MVHRVIEGGDGDDSLSGDDLGNILKGQGGDDVMYGEGGDDLLEGGDGGDLLVGGDGNDTLAGGQGFDWAFYSDKTVPVRITLSESGPSTVYVDGVAEDTLQDIEGIFGGLGDDVLTGNNQSNVFVAGYGKDVLSGGGGADDFSYTSTWHRGDIIQDFSPDEGDTISLEFYVPGGERIVFGGQAPGGFSVWYTPAENGRDVTVMADTNGDAAVEEFSITLRGITSLTEDNFTIWA